jgi:hypothetical protein
VQGRFFFVFGNGILEMLDGFIDFPLLQFELSEEKRIVREGARGCLLGGQKLNLLRCGGNWSGGLCLQQACTGHWKKEREKKRKSE